MAFLGAFVGTVAGWAFLVVYGDTIVEYLEGLRGE